MTLIQALLIGLALSRLAASAVDWRLGQTRVSLAAGLDLLRLDRRDRPKAFAAVVAVRVVVAVAVVLAVVAGT